MNSILLSINWQRLFLIVYLVILLILGGKFLNNSKELKLKLKDAGNKAQEIELITQEYIRKNPFSVYNSSLRLLLINALLVLRKKDDVIANVRKIRPIDIYSEFADVFTVVMFLLKELGYEEEYNYLDKKAKKSYKPCNSGICGVIMQQEVDISSISNDMIENKNNAIKAIVAYYRGFEFVKNLNYQEADRQFQIAIELYPFIKDVLEKKGYAK